MNTVSCSRSSAFRYSLLLTAFFLLGGLHTWADGLVDDFGSAKHPTRQALRGDWKFEGGVASCVADPELYKKYKDHGPILRWPVEFTDGTVTFEMKPKDCQRIVVTLNEAGHVFRCSLAADGRSRIFGWSGPSKENKPTPIASDGVPSAKQLEDKWTPCEISIKGGKGEIRIGDFEGRFEHACFSRKKGEFTISFAFGDLAVRKVRVTPAD